MTVNAALRNAIFLTGKSQRAIALSARLPEARLSAIIRGRAVPTEQEKRRLVSALRLAGVPTSTDELFPPQPEAVAP